jgi:hypothetical protein
MVLTPTTANLNRRLKMLKRYRSAAIAVSALVLASTALYAAGNYSTYPIVGQSSFCASTVSGAGGFNAVGNSNGVAPTGQGQATSGSICAQTVPAGPPAFTGNELIPMDTVPGSGVSPQTVTANINQLGQGAVVDSVASGAAITIPNNSQFFILDTGTAATVAVTMPAVAVEGQIQHVLCGTAIATSLSVAANSGQTIKGNVTPVTACSTAGPAFAWRFSAAANGLIAAGTWVRIQ